MAKKTVTFSIDEKVIDMINDIVKSKPEYENKSHLVAALLIREHGKLKKDK